MSVPGETILLVRDIEKSFTARTNFFGRPTHKVYASRGVSFLMSPRCNHRMSLC